MLNQKGATGSTAAGVGGQPDEVNELQRALRDDGYVTVAGVLGREEVQFLRLAVTKHLRAVSDCYNYGGKFQLQSRDGVPDIEKIIASNAVRRILAQLTEPFAFKLTEVCDLAINTTSQWHKDTSYFSVDIDGHAFTDEDFRLYKVAFYLQDQDEASRATLSVRPGSHLWSELTDLPVEKVVVHAGDMIVFDVRIDHLGQLPTLTDQLLRKSWTVAGPRLGIDAQKAFTRSRSLVRWISPGTIDRLAIFMTFGPSGTDAYAKAHPARAGRMRRPASLTHFPVTGRGVRA